LTGTRGGVKIGFGASWFDGGRGVGVGFGVIAFAGSRGGVGMGAASDFCS
jgi:hypothetical protein